MPLDIVKFLLAKIVVSPFKDTAPVLSAKSICSGLRKSRCHRDCAVGGQAGSCGNQSRYCRCSCPSGSRDSTTVKFPPRVVRPVPSNERVGLEVILPNVNAVVVAPPAVIVEPLIAVVDPTLPKVKALWVVVPMFKATAVAVSKVGAKKEVAA